MEGVDSIRMCLLLLVLACYLSSATTNQAINVQTIDPVFRKVLARALSLDGTDVDLLLGAHLLGVNYVSLSTIEQFVSLKYGRSFSGLLRPALGYGGLIDCTDYPMAHEGPVDVAGRLLYFRQRLHSKALFIQYHHAFNLSTSQLFSTAVNCMHTEDILVFYGRLFATFSSDDPMRTVLVMAIAKRWNLNNVLHAIVQSTFSAIRQWEHGLPAPLKSRLADPPGPQQQVESRRAKFWLPETRVLCSTNPVLSSVQCELLGQLGCSIGEHPGASGLISRLQDSSSPAPNRLVRVLRSLTRRLDFFASSIPKNEREDDGIVMTQDTMQSIVLQRLMEALVAVAALSIEEHVRMKLPTQDADEVATALRKLRKELMISMRDTHSRMDRFQSSLLAKLSIIGGNQKYVVCAVPIDFGGFIIRHMPERFPGMLVVIVSASRFHQDPRSMREQLSHFLE
jgi:hypothetical protein